jgi:hypothetical protein
LGRAEGLAWSAEKIVDMNDDVDPLDDVVLDEDFVRRAPTHEPSADIRYERARSAREATELLLAQRSLDEWIDQHRRRRRRWRAVVALLVLLAIVSGTFRYRPSTTPSNPWASAEAPSTNLIDSDGSRPSPQKAISTTPLGVPPQVARPSDAFRFAATQSGSDRPVAYDPCRSIPIVINLRTAPSVGRDLTLEAIAEIHRATGMSLLVEGDSDEVPAVDRPVYQLERYGDRWAPVLVAWSDPDESPKLMDDTAGYGGSARVVRGDGESVYLTGLVALDGPQLANILDRPNGRAQARGVIMHGLAHVVGLDHVDDPTQLMNPYGSPCVTSFQDGDRTGLSALGRGRCFDTL